MDIHHQIKKLLDYAVKSGLIKNEDRNWAANAVIAKLKLSFFNPPKTKLSETLPKYPDKILSEISLWAVENKIIGKLSVERELLETDIIGIFTQRPSDFIASFHEIEKKKGIKQATDWMYEKEQQACYVKTENVKRNIVWKTKTKYGFLDLTINLSKPEKTLKEIEAVKALGAKALFSKDYPKCVLCPENEGYAGRIDYPARQNARLIPLTLNKEEWYMQYSPYVYYNEHCIILSKNHSDMKINEKTFVRFADFLERFPHYFIGSNADLPIVGGSILNHDHYQGGRFEFPLHRAKIDRYFKLKGFPKAEFSILKWPMSVIRIKGNRKDVLDAVGVIFDKWKNYSDKNVEIKAYDKTVSHNTITPLARMVKDKIQFDLVLRNNAISEDFPNGIFHSKPLYHHIKHENIGLIEALGMAILPGRLKTAMKKAGDYLLCGDINRIKSDKETVRHYEWALELSQKYKINSANIEEILKKEIGMIFEQSLECCGVFKKDLQGTEAFDRFIEELNK
ncbi:MAG: UDP-glucose--hexose-1-phosphate uridylyltransferase [Elusimicrobiota bacterium]|jgi:UDPglucose--hexose-1-phosphate uridylyltransferase|nr:UDP-glucose--hexose-1-phosphate uridylyltransferase [Elusimicrobiota bacterium]